MHGSDLIKEFARKIEQVCGHGTATDAKIAATLGITLPGLNKYRSGVVTPRQVVNLSRSFAKAQRDHLISSTIVPIVEFMPIDAHMKGGGRSFQIFPTEAGSRSHPYLQGLRDRLEKTHGIYVFHDSRGRSIYAGKAHKLSLWSEMNNAFNRDRREVQSIKRVSHPTNRIAYKRHDEKSRQIVRQAVPLHDIAAYFSAFEVPELLIGKFEALIVRAFANDLLNVRMENF